MLTPFPNRNECISYAIKKIKYLIVHQYTGCIICMKIKFKLNQKYLGNTDFGETLLNQLIVKRFGLTKIIIIRQ